MRCIVHSSLLELDPLEKMSGDFLEVLISAGAYANAMHFLPHAISINYIFECGHP